MISNKVLGIVNFTVPLFYLLTLQMYDIRLCYESNNYILFILDAKVMSKTCHDVNKPARPSPFSFSISLISTHLDLLSRSIRFFSPLRCFARLPIFFNLPTNYICRMTAHTYHLSLPWFRPCVYTWTNEETSKESVSFNHAGSGKLNYPDRRRRMKKGDGGWKSGRGTEPMGVGLSRRPYRTDPLMIGYNGAACTTG